MKTWNYNFQPQFQKLVKAGAKKQTIRPLRKDGKAPEPGDKIQCFVGHEIAQAGYRALARHWDSHRVPSEWSESQIGLFGVVHRCRGAA